MGRQLEPWGGEVKVPRLLKRLLRRKDTKDSPERAEEARRTAHRARGPEMSVLENADRVVFGGFSEGHPGNRDAPRGRY